MGSLFSGAGGFDLGFEAAGFEVAWQVEIDRDCVSVLERHWPGKRRLGDVREVDPERDLTPVDVVVFGSPCQGFSVAGKRGGLADERSGLFGEAVRIIRGLRPGPTLVLWENVPGSFTTGESDPDDPERDVRGRDFAAVLAALANLGALDIAWRVLDSQGVGDCALHRDRSGFWAVPQRRRRIFLVADFGAERAVEVLALADGVSRHPAARRKARQGAANAVQGGPGVDQQAVAPTLRSSDGGASNADNFTLVASVTAEGGNRTSGPIDVTPALLAHGGPNEHQDFESETFIVASESGQGWWNEGRIGPLRAEGDNRPSRPSTIIASPPVAAPLTAGSHDSHAPGRRQEDDENLVVAAFDEVQITSRGNRSSVEADTPATTLNGSGRAGVILPTEGAVAYSIYPKGDGTPDIGATETDVSQAVTANHGTSQNRRGTHVVEPEMGGWIVRRLMPVECERLQGWPDGHTRYRADGREIADGPRYRMIGNGVSSTVAYWLARRMRAVLERAS